MKTLPARAVLLVPDGVGVGAAPDAAVYGDQDAHSVLHCAQARGGLDLPVLESLGLTALLGQPKGKARVRRGAFYGTMHPSSPGKDTITGHWEMMGLVLDRPFPTFPQGIPSELLEEIRRQTGQEFLGGYPSSGTAVLEALGEDHLRTGKPIVYTSADSVLQIAAHVDILTVEALHALCLQVRAVSAPWRIARVIARPFLGSPGAFRRTKDRKDFSLPPPGRTFLDRLASSAIPVAAVGKICDIFSGQGICVSFPAENNHEVCGRLLELMDSFPHGLVFANLNDFDTLYGHRRDPQGYGAALEAFDDHLACLLSRLEDRDVLLLCSDHGCDPTHPGTDHTRESVPLIAYSRSAPGSSCLGVRQTFADVAATLAEFFSVPWKGPGKGFLSDLGIPVRSG
mgnify:CR=1 FL=1